jgi:hypothetical protein
MTRHLLTLWVLALSGCTCDRAGAPDAGPRDAGPQVLVEKEPNDSAERAMLIDRTSLVEANLGADPARPDADWYALRSALPKTVALEVSCPPGADLALEVVDETGTVLSAVNAAGPEGTERLPNLDVSGQALIRVVSLKRGAGGAYRLTARFADRQPGYELEPDDRRVDATQVALGQAISGYLAHPGDVDVFRFEMPAPTELAADQVPAETTDAGSVANDGATGETLVPDAGPAKDARRVAIRVDLSAVEGVAFDVQVMTEAEAVLFAARSRENGALSLRNVGVRETDQVVYVALRSSPLGTGKDQRRGYNDGLSYTLTVAQEEAGASAELEPNDDPSHATELSANGYREGYLSPRGDVDYFRLLVDGPSIATLQLTGVEKVDVALSVVSAADGKPEELLLRANEGGTREPEQLNSVACAGACLIKVEAAQRKVDGKWVRDDENSDSPYRLSATVVPDDGSGEKEPNNALATATPIGFGKPMRGTIFPKKDVDYFQLDLRDREVKTPLTATVTGVLKVDVGLYLHRAEADGKLTLVQTSDGAKGDRPETVRFAAEPGLYVLEVRDARNREANFQDSYQLSVDEEAE